MNTGACKNQSAKIPFLISSKNEKFENAKYIIKRPFTEVIRCDILMQPDYLDLL